MGLISWVWSRFARPGRTESALNELEELRPLTEQFYVTLMAAASRVQKQSLSGDLGSRVEAFLGREGEQRTWIDAYEMEQTLVYLYDEPTLRTELGCRLLEARSVLRPALVTWYAEQSGKAETGDAQRPLLARLVNDLQWRYTVNELKRHYAKVVTRKTGMVFLCALAIFVVALVLRTFGDAPQAGEFWLLVLAGSAGLWGASFSLLGSLKSRLDAAELDDLKVMRHYGAIVTRALIGAGGALILYFFLRSGLLGGSAFPKIVSDGTQTNEALALLVVWCFIAGFSEQLVPGLLARTEARADDHLTPTARVAPAGEPFPTPPKPDAGEKAGEKETASDGVSPAPAAAT